MKGLEIRCTMVSALVLRVADGATQVLLVRRAGPYLKGVWSYVAGHIEAGESGWQAACRELAEETGLTPRALYATSFCEQFYAPGDDCIMVVPAFVAYVDANATVTLNDEHTAFRWLAFDAAMQAVPFGSQRDLFAQVRHEFIERPASTHLRIDVD